MAALTKKDKKLIYFCSVFAAASLAYMLLISPKMIELADIKADYSNAYNLANDVSFKLSGFEISQTYLDETKEDFCKNAEGFCNMAETEEVDEFISQTARRQKLVPQSLEISEESLFLQLEPYSDKESTDSYDEEEDSEEGSDDFLMSDYIFQRKCVVTVKGTMPQVMDYVDTLNSTDGFRITSIDFINESQDGGDTYLKADSAQVSAAISFTIYRYDKEGAEEMIISYADSPYGYGNTDSEEQTEDSSEAE